MQNYRFIDKYGSFELEGAENDKELYFPIAGENGIKSSLTPNLFGDSKLDQNHFLLEPVSIENLRNNRSSRNFWCIIQHFGAWSVTGASAEQEATHFTDVRERSGVRAGLMWHETWRKSMKYQLEASVTSFVPLQKNVEIMLVSITNTARMSISFTPLAAVPLYGRSADNIRDHRHVTSLLNRTVVTEYGIHLKPSLSFDERGHQENHMIYYVEGMDEYGKAPESFYPELDAYCGKGGSLECPQTVCEIRAGVNENGEKPGFHCDGQEAMGGLKFHTVTLNPGETAEFAVFIGVEGNEQDIMEAKAAYTDCQKVKEELELTKQYWKNKINVDYHTGNPEFDCFMKWVSFQPELRRIYGCSFLPHHDYGKGGRGWRDLWQDCMALLLMNPSGVRQMLLSNFEGVRIDGTNATIIGEHPGEFKADRNAITRVWMDHGVWPFVTTKLYLDQTGDTEILHQKIPFFKDRQVLRGQGIDDRWDGTTLWQTDVTGEMYVGTVLEHLLVQFLTASYEVGNHGHIRLRDADWNDALDMAGEYGESVAFTNAYAMNLLQLSEILKREAEHGINSIELFEELELLLTDNEKLYESIEEKRELLDNYLKLCIHEISGRRVKVETNQLAKSLETKAFWIMDHIRKSEWVTDSSGNGWFNGYYDNHGRRVEGETEDGQIRMMLTSQVFAIMSGTAKEEQIKEIVKTADQYLFDEACGGYRLNTNFNELKTDMGRMFGFAYGEKENGAVFSHMAVMYAYALYSRGFTKEGYKALKALAEQSMDFEHSRIYPGIPEYFGKDGRGMYHYLTGAASWYMLTVITRMFGIHGEYGDLVMEPRLIREQFDENGKAAIQLKFADISWNIEFENTEKLEVGEYEIREAFLDGNPITAQGNRVVLRRHEIETLDSLRNHKIVLRFGVIASV